MKYSQARAEQKKKSRDRLLEIIRNPSVSGLVTFNRVSIT